MRIEKLSHRSYNGEIASVASSLNKASLSYDFSTDTYSSGLLSQLRLDTQKLIEAINRNTIESLLETKDDNRDQKLRSIFYLNTGYLHSPDATISAAAQAIDRILNTYGLTRTIKQNFAQESALIDSLLQELQSTENQAQLALLPGMGQCVENLTEAQADFATTVVNMQQGKPNMPNWKKAHQVPNEKQLMLGYLRDHS